MSDPSTKADLTDASIIHVDRPVTLNPVQVNYTVTASGGVFYINGQSNPSFNFYRGGVYLFNLNDSSVNNHPFVLQTASGGYDSSTRIDTNVEYKLDDSVVSASSYISGFSSASQRSLKFTVTPIQALGTIYYVCTNHSNMGNSIVINDTNFDLDLTDGEVYVLNKPISDSTNLAFDDSHITSFNEVSSDSSALGDTYGPMTFNSVKDSAAGLTETTAFDISLVLADSMSLSDSFGTTGALILSDSIGLSDAIVNGQTFERNFFDSANYSDAIQSSISLGLNLSDSMALTDTLNSITKGLSFSDGLTITDDFDGDNEHDGGRQYQKSITNVLTLTETVAKVLPNEVLTNSSSLGDDSVVLLGKQLPDSGNFSESLSFFVSDYCDPTYFAGQYVGTIITP